MSSLVARAHRTPGGFAAYVMDPALRVGDRVIHTATDLFADAYAALQYARDYIASLDAPDETPIATTVVETITWARNFVASAAKDLRVTPDWRKALRVCERLNALLACAFRVVAPSMAAHAS